MEDGRLYLLRMGGRIWNAVVDPDDSSTAAIKSAAVDALRRKERLAWCMIILAVVVDVIGRFINNVYGVWMRRHSHLCASFFDRGDGFGFVSFPDGSLERYHMFK